MSERHRVCTIADIRSYKLPFTDSPSMQNWKLSIQFFIARYESYLMELKYFDEDLYNTVMAEQS